MQLGVTSERGEDANTPRPTIGHRQEVLRRVLEREVLVGELGTW